MGAYIRDRVSQAGCEISPDWVDGATLLVPWTPEQLDEFGQLGHEIQAHHIVALARDVDAIKDALRQNVPNRQRPRVAFERPTDCNRKPCVEEEDDVEDIVVVETGYHTDSSAGYPQYT